MRGDGSKRLSILSEAETVALYGLPDFDDFQRAEFFAMTTAERALASRRPGLEAQVHCLLQIGYFKAKQAFFQFMLNDAPVADVAFLLQRYFHGRTLAPRRLNTNECYVPRREIAALFGYRLWSDRDLPALQDKAIRLTRTDVSPTFLLTELLAFLISQRIVRPGYTTLQNLIGGALTTERDRLERQVEKALDEVTCAAIQKLLVREDTLSALAAIKQDAKHFRPRMMARERQKRATLAPLYVLAKELLPSMNISRQNIAYYASLANFYTITDLRRFRLGRSGIYLLCYAWQRYRELSDNLVEAFGYQLRQLEAAASDFVREQAAKAQTVRQQAEPKLGQLLLLYVDERFDDATPFGVVRRQAFSIMPQEALHTAGTLLCQRQTSPMDWSWEAVDRQAARCTNRLRPLALALDFRSVHAHSPWLGALAWMKDVFSRRQRLSQRPLAEIPAGTLPQRLRPYLLRPDAVVGEPAVLHDARYEFWIYRQLRKRIEMGDIYLDDSVQHRCFGDELIAPERKAEALNQLDIPWLRQPIDATLAALLADLAAEWRDFDRELRQGRLKHLEFDSAQQTLRWHRPKANQDMALTDAFYAKVPPRDVTDIFRFVNEQCRFLSIMTPLQPRYAKKVADNDSLMAVILAQAMNHGNFSLAATGDIPYHVLEATHQQYLRLATLKAANDQVSNFIACLPIFPYYSFDLEVLYGSVDGQKFSAADPTLKARFSRKYFGRDRGVVAYSLLANHVPLQTELLGANQHESYWVFDICYNNTADIAPMVITGDMHSINKANFAILHWFGMNLAPRFTDLQAQLKHLYWSGDPAVAAGFLVRPAGHLDIQLILAEEANLDRIIATLGLKEMSQSTLVRKLCTLSGHHRTRQAVFEFDKLIRSLYTLRYLRDPQLQRNVHRSQNRIEAYHQLRAAITQVAGKKELIGSTDLDVAISNQCGRLLANVVIAYNSMLLSALLERYLATGNQRALDRLRQTSPVAWQHIHFLGHYTFRAPHHPIDLAALLAGVDMK